MDIKILENNDLTAIFRLLNHYNLITQDIDFNNQYFLGLKQQQNCIAIGALEFYRPYALIRSVAVSEKEKHKGYAKQICKALFQHALSENIIELYLLTETAEEFFSRQGFEIIDRNTAPQIIKSTSQFSTLCPDDARVMKYRFIPSI